MRIAAVLVSTPLLCNRLRRACWLAKAKGTTGNTLRGSLAAPPPPAKSSRAAGAGQQEASLLLSGDVERDPANLKEFAIQVDADAVTLQDLPTANTLTADKLIECATAWLNDTRGLQLRTLGIKLKPNDIPRDVNPLNWQKILPILNSVQVPTLVIASIAPQAGLSIQQLQQDLKREFDALPQGVLTSDAYESAVRALKAFGHTTQYLRVARPLPLQVDVTSRSRTSTAAVGSTWPKSADRFEWSTADVMAFVRPLLAEATPEAEPPVSELDVAYERVAAFLVHWHAFVPATAGLAALHRKAVWRVIDLNLTSGRLDGHAMTRDADGKQTVIAVAEFKAQGVDFTAMEECGLGRAPFDIIAAMHSRLYQTDFGCLARRIVGQLVGYLCTASEQFNRKVRIGVHSCYHSFQFVIYREEERRLLVSRVYPYDAQNPSIIQLLMYAAHLAEEQPGSAFVLPPVVGQPVEDDAADDCERHYARFKLQRSAQGSGSNPYRKIYSNSKDRTRAAQNTGGGGGGTSCSGAVSGISDGDTENCYSHLTFERHALGTGITGPVWAGRLDGKRVAIKLVTCGDDVRESLHHEAQVYTALSELQGRYLPRVEATSHLRSTFCLVLELLAGQDPEALSACERARLWPSALQALGAMHGSGWLHGDLRSENIMCDVETEQVKLLDLGCSRWVNAEADCCREVAQLADIFGVQYASNGHEALRACAEYHQSSEASRASDDPENAVSSIASEPRV